MWGGSSAPIAPQSAQQRHFAFPSALVGCVRLKFRDFKLPGACFLSWSPENNAAVSGGERVFTHYMRVKSAHLGVVLVLIGLFPPVGAPSLCSIFQCPPVLVVFTAVHLTSSLLFPHRWCFGGCARSGLRLILGEVPPQSHVQRFSVFLLLR